MGEGKHFHIFFLRNHKETQARMSIIFLSLILSGIQKFTEHMCERVLRCLDYMICMIHVRRWECCYGNCSRSWILSWRISQSTIKQAHLWAYLLGDIKYFQFFLKRCIIFCPGFLKLGAPHLSPLPSTQCFCDLETTEEGDLTEFCVEDCWGFPTVYAVSFNFQLDQKATNRWVFLLHAIFPKAILLLHKMLYQIQSRSY